jgi:hypothetical protein
LGLRFHYSAQEQTTPELLEGLNRSSRLSAEQKTRIEELLTRLDLVKFARSWPSPQETEALLVAARKLIQETTDPVSGKPG